MEYTPDEKLIIDYVTSKENEDMINEILPSKEIIANFKSSEVVNNLNNDALLNKSIKELKMGKISTFNKKDFFMESFYSSCIGGSGCYQFVLIIIIMLSCMFVEIISVSIALWEKKPTADIYVLGNKTTLNSYEVQYEYCNKEKYIISNIIYNKYSIIGEFEIYCNEFLVGLLGTCFLGLFFGAFAVQIVPSIIGRKNTIMLALIAFMVFAFITTLINKNLYYLIYLFLIFNQFFAMIVSYTGLIFLVESGNSKVRPIFSSLVNAAYCISGIFFATFYTLYEPWRAGLYLCCAINVICLLLIFFFSTEHPRFYFYKRDLDNFLISSEKISKMRS